MARRWGRCTAAASATAIIIVAAIAPAHGALPLIAGLGKQLIKNMLIDGVKSQLVGSLADSGCKGAAIASLVAGSPARGIGGLLGGGAMPALPSGVALPSGMPPMGAMPAMGDAVAVRAARGGAGVANVPAGVDPRAMDMSQLMAMAQSQMGGRAGGMPAMSPEQVAQMNSAMAAMQQAMAQPLSPAETKAVFDELATLGVMTPAMQSEMSDCLALAPPSASAGMGMSAALMKNMVLPQLRTAREQ